MSSCACGYTNVPGTLFCEGCGSALTPEAQGQRYATGSINPAAAHGAGAPDVVATPVRGATGDVSAAASAVEPAAFYAGDEDEPVPAGTIPTQDSAATARAPGSAGQNSVQPDVSVEPEPQASPGPAIPAPATAAPTSVYLISESGRRVDVPRQDVVIVGREDMRSGIRPDVDLTLDGASAAGVSRRHCRLLRQRDGWYVEDLMSTNYTVLNGKPLRAHAPARVTHGDELRLGKLRLRFHET